MLSLPYAFRACGLVIGSIVLLVSGLASGLTFDLLVSLSRADGSNSYEDVVGSALGPRFRNLTGLMLFALTYMCSIAYLVLVADLVSPVVGWCCFEVTRELRNSVMIVVMLFVTPLCLQPSLSSLRIFNMVSLMTVVLVAVAVAYITIPSLGVPHLVWTQSADGQLKSQEILATMRWWPEDWVNAVYALPLFALAYMAHFNVLPAMAALHRPTRWRSRQVVVITVTFCIFFYGFFGVVGYAYAGDFTCGNTLLNFMPNSPLLTAMRTSLAFCLTINLPLLILPCRSALHRLLPCLQSELVPDVQDVLSYHSVSSVHSVHVYERGAEDSGACDFFLPKVAAATLPELSTAGRVSVTLVLVITITTLGCLLPSILVVWTLAGSTTCFVIAFVLPALAWLRARGAAAKVLRRAAAWATLVAAIVCMIPCTILAAYRLDPDPCPN